MVTRSQAEMLCIFADLQQEKGRPPTTRELASAMGCTEHNVTGRMRPLKAKGIVKYGKPFHGGSMRLAITREKAIAILNWHDSYPLKEETLHV